MGNGRTVAAYDLNYMVVLIIVGPSGTWHKSLLVQIALSISLVRWLAFPLFPQGFPSFGDASTCMSKGTVGSVVRRLVAPEE